MTTNHITITRDPEKRKKDGLTCYDLIVTDPNGERLATRYAYGVLHRDSLKDILIDRYNVGTGSVMGINEFYNVNRLD